MSDSTRAEVINLKKLTGSRLEKGTWRSVPLSTTPAQVPPIDTLERASVAAEERRTERRHHWH